MGYLAQTFNRSTNVAHIRHNVPQLNEVLIFKHITMIEKELQDEIAKLKAENEKLKLRLAVVSVMLPIDKLEEKIEHLIKWNRKICWEAEYENDNYCIGENKLRDFIRELKRGN